jgi:hypothetical protein
MIVEMSQQSLNADKLMIILDNHKIVNNKLMLVDLIIR